jgi:hypothetical protein
MIRTASSHILVESSALYFGTPVALISTLNTDGTANLTANFVGLVPRSTVVLGLGMGARRWTTRLPGHRCGHPRRPPARAGAVVAWRPHPWR